MQTNFGRGSRSGDYHHGYNPYVPHQYRNRNGYRNYGVVYGYPFYPFSYGFNSGWYGSGYGDNYNTYPYNGYSFGASSVNDSADVPAYGNGGGGYGGGDVPVPARGGTASGTATVSTPTSVSVRAQIDNAVDHSPALVSANSAVTAAQSQYNEARDRTLAGLREQPDYQQAMARRRSASEAVKAAKADGGVASPTSQPSQSVAEAAQTKLEAGDEVTKMEEQAVAKDPAAVSAKARLEQAIADRNSLKAQLTAQMESAGHGN